MKFNPNDSQYDKKDFKKLSVGEKVFGAVGYERFTSKNGNSCVDVRFTCLDDFGDGEDNGLDVREMFAFTEKAFWKFAGLCRALGIEEGFDPENDDELMEALTSAYFTGNVELETYESKGKERQKPIISDYTVFSGKDDPEWEDLLSAGEDRHAEYLGWREKNPRGQNSGGGSKSNDDVPF